MEIQDKNDKNGQMDATGARDGGGGWGVGKDKRGADNWICSAGISEDAVSGESPSAGNELSVEMELRDNCAKSARLCRYKHGRGARVHRELTESHHGRNTWLVIDPNLKIVLQIARV